MTVREQFEQVKEPWGKEAIAESVFFLLDHESEGLKEDIISNIIWDNTTQGYDYWDKIHKSLNG